MLGFIKIFLPAILITFNTMPTEGDPIGTEEVIAEETTEEVATEEGTIEAEIAIPEKPEEIEKIPDEEKILIEVFSDFECTHCKEHAQIIQKLRERNDLKIIFYNLPLSYHELATEASKADICARQQEKEWEMNNLIFENQNNLNREAYLEYAKTLELNIDTFSSCLDSEETIKQLEEEIKKGKEKKLKGIPTTIINGEKILGNIPIENLEKIIRKHQNNS